ncbi:MAG: esterase-like activity of phytase family protein [Alphaproteobacteria bacterium]|nr:esterase-like activity of phytase family protein [Alphaproteobacteria bacterium]
MLFRIALLAMMAILSFPAMPHADPVEVSSELLPLNPAKPAEKAIGALEYMGGMELISHDRRFGGLSGLSVSPDGVYLTAISDRGYMFSASLRYSVTGALTGIGQTIISDLLDFKGAPLKPGWRDAESITQDEDGTFLISFERNHRIWRYVAQEEGDNWEPVGMLRSTLFDALTFNTGIEAFTMADADTLLAISEEGKAWLINDVDGRTQIVRFPKLGEGYHPTDIARLPDGSFLLLARQYYPLRSGASARLLRMALSKAPDGVWTLTKERIAELVPPVSVDNMEGISVRQDKAGNTLIYLISDDNYRLWQRTLLTMFRYRP